MLSINIKKLGKIVFWQTPSKMDYLRLHIDRKSYKS
jgi:hypothetical protein